MIIEPLLNQGKIREAKILLVDDHEDGVVLLQQLLQKAGYANVFATTDSRDTVRMCEELSIDLLVLDLNMPPPSGYDILDQLALRPGKENGLPILVLTADITPMAKLKALSLGAKDFLTKPVEQVDLLLRVRNLLEAQFLYRQIGQGRPAADAPRSKPRAPEEIAERLFAVMECCDPRLAERALRVSRWSARLARAMGLDAAEVLQIESAARLYDLGMLTVAEDARRAPVSSLEKKRLLRGHVSMAGRILGETAGHPAMQAPLEIATRHHERWDGNGYPDGLSGEAIPPAARIVAVAEAMDTLTNPEAGALPCSVEQAMLEVTRHAGFAFDPAVVEALRRTDAKETMKEEEALAQR